MPFLEHGALSLYYESYGNGPPLLLIAGLASDSQSWQPVIPILAERFRVIVFDNRGSGRSRPMNDFVGVSGMAGDALLILDHLGIRAAHLLGHSMGGFIAQELAMRQPLRVRSLVLAATACRISPKNSRLFIRWRDDRAKEGELEQWFREIFSWLFTRSFMENKGEVAAALEYAMGYPYPQSSTAFAQQVRAMEEFDLSEDLPSLTPPTLVITGREDLLFPPESAAALARLIPSAEVATIENAAHSIHPEQPERFCRAVIPFLEKSTNGECRE